MSLTIGYVDGLLAIPEDMQDIECLIDLDTHLFSVPEDPSITFKALLKTKSETDIRTRFRVNMLGKRLLTIDEKDVDTLHHTTYKLLSETINDIVYRSKTDSLYELESYCRIHGAVSGIITPMIKDNECTLANVRSRLILVMNAIRKNES
jgi:hypothetical protein